MALREFMDDEGRQWRVWDVAPDQFHAVTNWEDYLQGYIDGWLVFEAIAGEERCRLYPIPAGWETASASRLEELRRMATTDATVQRSSPGRSLGVTRTFHYPSGRVWSAAEIPVQYRDPDGNALGTPVTVLRFASGRRTMDLLAWPDGWHRYTEGQLAELLTHAFPREQAAENPTPHRRRTIDADPESQESGNSSGPPRRS